MPLPGPRLEIAICSADRDGQPVLEIVTASCVQDGHEIHNTYGEHGNAELLHRYGFSLISNPFNVIILNKQAVIDAASNITGDETSTERCKVLEENR